MSKGPIIALLIFLALIGLFFGSAHWMASRYAPDYVKHYQALLDEFNTPEAFKKFLEHYPEVSGLGWRSCLDWLSERLVYSSPTDPIQLEQWKIVKADGRPEDPVEILEDTPKVTDHGKIKALGRCGEFSLVYAQMLLINGYHPLFAMGVHEGGDHVWVELKGDKPTIIDPTDACAWRTDNPDVIWTECPHIGNDPRLVADVQWISVYRIDFDNIEKCTKFYNGEETNESK